MLLHKQALSRVTDVQFIGGCSATVLLHWEGGATRLLGRLQRRLLYSNCLSCINKFQFFSLFVHVEIL